MSDERLEHDAERWREQERSAFRFVQISEAMLSQLSSAPSEPVRIAVRPIEGNRVELVCQKAFRSAGFNALVDARHGPMLVNRHDIYVGGSFLAYGEFSHGETELFERLITPGMVVINAGANIGAHVVRQAQLCAPGLCYAFEPQRLAYQLLVANVALNSLSNVHAFRMAMSDTPGILHVPCLDPHVRQNVGGLEMRHAEDAESEIVGAGRIDDLALPRCDFLMADVEGMEAAVLRGARETIARCLPILYVEADRQAQRPGLLAVLTEIGYAAYWHTPPLYRPDNYRAYSVDLFPNVVSLNWLCVPEERTIHESWVRVTESNL